MHTPVGWNQSILFSGDPVFWPIRKFFPFFLEFAEKKELKYWIKKGKFSIVLTPYLFSFLLDKFNFHTISTICIYLRQVSTLKFVLTQLLTGQIPMLFEYFVWWTWYKQCRGRWRNNLCSHHLKFGKKNSKGQFFK